MKSAAGDAGPLVCRGCMCGVGTAHVVCETAYPICASHDDMNSRRSAVILTYLLHELLVQYINRSRVLVGVISLI